MDSLQRVTSVIRKSGQMLHIQETSWYKINTGGSNEPIRGCVHSLYALQSQHQGPTVLKVITFDIFGGISMFWVEFKFQEQGFHVQSCCVMK